MAQNGRLVGCTQSEGLFSQVVSITWRLSLAMFATAIALPLFASIIGAPVAIAVMRAGCKPLKDYFTNQANQVAAKKVAKRRK